MYRNKKKLSLIIIYLVLTASNTVLFSQGNKQSQGFKTYTIGYMKDVFYDVDLNDVQAVLRIWVNETVKLYKGSNNFQLNNKIYENLRELSGSLVSDNIAAVSISTNDYIQSGNKIGLEPLLVPEIENEVGIEYYLLVRKDDHYKSIKELKGKTVGLISTPIYMASSLWLDVLLAKNNLPVKEKYFNKIDGVQKESQLILNLFFGNLDACVVSKMAFRLMKELNPQVGEKLINIAVSPAYLSGFLCFMKSNKDSGFKKIFYESTIKLHELSYGRQIFTLLKIGKLVPFKEEYLNNYKELLRDHKKLVKNSK